MSNCKTISLYDSLNTSAMPMDIVENFLVMKSAEKNIPLGSWTKVYQDSQRQNNFNDCGVYVCMNVRNSSEQTNFKYYLDISTTRSQIELKLLSSKLLSLL